MADPNDDFPDETLQHPAPVPTRAPKPKPADDATLGETLQRGTPTNAL